MAPAHRRAARSRAGSSSERRCGRGARFLRGSHVVTFLALCMACHECLTPRTCIVWMSVTLGGQHTPDYAALIRMMATEKQTGGSRAASAGGGTIMSMCALCMAQKPAALMTSWVDKMIGSSGFDLNLQCVPVGAWRACDIDFWAPHVLIRMITTYGLHAPTRSHALARTAKTWA